MIIFIGADHRGFALKQTVIPFLRRQGHEVIDAGTRVEGIDCDYPQISRDVAAQVAKHAGSRGILLCMTGIGHSIAANKVPGAYAALVYNNKTAALSRRHNNANILVLGAKFIDEGAVEEIIAVWLATEFEGGRHARRFEQIKNIEKEFLR
ncbi:MAG: ribose 5-phosphate isomerase B [Candidatus Omnitrophica bacterium]|nr:ribose 5-phosphate isomerase B [Candidatus Omnitrophota bacterium]